MPEHVVILKTGRLHELELACNALKESDIPHYRQEENITGLKTAMVVPAMEPGTFWNILVPVSAKAAAEKILESLPIDFTTNPDPWHFQPTAKVKRGWKIYIIIILGVTTIVLAFNIIELLIK